MVPVRWERRISRSSPVSLYSDRELGLASLPSWKVPAEPGRALSPCPHRAQFETLMSLRETLFSLSYRFQRARGVSGFPVLIRFLSRHKHTKVRL